MNACCRKFGICLSGIHVVRRIAIILAAVPLMSGVAEQALAATSSSTFRFSLPGGAAILYSTASNPQALLPERSCQRAVFHFPNGATFSLLPRIGKSDTAGAEIEPPNESDISPSGQYVVIGRVESGMVSSGPGQSESVLSREYCSVIKIRTGCITADQTGEICGAGWQAGQPAQWGTDDQTNVMLRRDRPSANRVLHFISAGQPPRSIVDDDSGADNVLRCDPPSPASRQAYQKIAIALRAAGAQSEARLIEAGLSKVGDSAPNTPLPSPTETEHLVGIVSVEKAMLYTAPNDARASRAYLVRNDTVTVLKQVPTGWAYVDYVNASGKHLLRWSKAEQLTIKP
ncbi:hypothetical protein LMG24076_03927 [Trinickia soli]|nr:hypothetical protein LMG24076_03927 [Trinickia soli]